ncbi:hypothetical protein ACOME3_009138 [Neoechinorhynchus agilis]
MSNEPILLTVVIDQLMLENCCNNQLPSTVVLKLANIATRVGDLCGALVNHLSNGCSVCQRGRNSACLFYPARNRWLLKSKWPLHKYGMPSKANNNNDHVVVYTAKVKRIKIKLPDNTVRTHWVDFSVRTYLVVRALCRELGISHSEELGLQKPSIQNGSLFSRAGRTSSILSHSSATSIDRGPLQRRPNSITEFNNGISSLGRSRGNGLLKKLNLSKSTSRLEALESASCATLFESDEPSHSSTKTLDKHRRSMSSSKETIFNSLKTGHNNGAIRNYLGDLDLADACITSAQKIAQSALWLSSTKSLMEQNVVDGDLLFLKFKYYLFIDLDSEVDTIRVAQLFAQARNEVINELDCITEDQLYTFAGLQLQTELESSGYSDHALYYDTQGIYANQTSLKKCEITKNKNSNEEDLLAKIDHCLAVLPLDNVRSDSGISSGVPWRCASYIRYNRSFKGFFIICDDGPSRDVTGARMLVYKSENDAKQKNPISRGLIDVIDLFGCKIETNLTNAKGANPRFVLRIQAFLSKASEMWLKFYSVDLYATWTAALRVAARGEGLNENSCLAEQEIVLIDLRMRICKPEIETIADGENSDKEQMNIEEHVQSLEVDSELYLARWFVNKKSLRSKPKNRDATAEKIKHFRSFYRHFNLNEARLRYIQLWQSLPQFGRVYFNVRFNKPNAHEVRRASV